MAISSFQLRRGDLRFQKIVEHLKHCLILLDVVQELGEECASQEDLQKTGTAVNTVLPPFVVKELAATPRVTDKLYFWSGNGELETAVKDWQAKIRTLFDLSGVAKGENFMVSHRLRDTFAVECLLAGVPLERVSILLGHSTIKVTERHYAPWIQKRQQQLEADLRAMWQGTKEVQPQNKRPN